MAQEYSCTHLANTGFGTSLKLAAFHEREMAQDTETELFEK